MAAPSITIKTRTKPRRQPRPAAAAESAPRHNEPPHTQELWAYRRRNAIAMSHGEIDSTFLYFSETAPEWWLK